MEILIKEDILIRDMNNKIFVLLLIFMLGCSGINAPNDDDPDLRVSCMEDSECKTPMEYLIQSNCPFSSACMDGSCKVVCPITYHDPNLSISMSYAMDCRADDDCDCSERSNRSIRCVCHEGACLSVEGQ